MFVYFRSPVSFRTVCGLSVSFAVVDGVAVAGEAGYFAKRAQRDSVNLHAEVERSVWILAITSCMSVTS